jgi:hypothetical protein
MSKRLSADPHKTGPCAPCGRPKWRPASQKQPAVRTETGLCGFATAMDFVLRRAEVGQLMSWYVVGRQGDGRFAANHVDRVRTAAAMRIAQAHYYNLPSSPGKPPSRAISVSGKRSLRNSRARSCSGRRAGSPLRPIA